ncbi:hypothetical protein BDW22DRAFT_988627 [Trametopsis cervina]|nr:hypothetical protein BDW22DRAFT_988627 [Trametopsis cervina]
MRGIQRKSQLLQMMYTCRDLYEAGVPLLLALPIRIKHPQLRSFCRYIMADTARCRHFRNLALFAQRFSSNGTTKMSMQREALLQLARHALNLEKLEIKGRFLRLDPRYVEAYGSFKNLRHLRIWGYSPKLIARFLSSLKCSLRAVYVHYSDTSGRFSSVLASCDEDLETLHIFNCTLPNMLEPVAMFPNLTKLRLENITSGNGPFLMKSFPNLRHLSCVNCTDLSGNVSSNFVFSELAKIRRASIEEQLRSKCGWRSLSSVAGPVLWLYGLGIMCPVGKLSLKFQHWIQPDMHNACHPDVVEYARPKRMSISFSLYECEKYIHGVLGTMPPTVQKFELEVEGRKGSELENMLVSIHSIDRFLC